MKKERRINVHDFSCWHSQQQIDSFSQTDANLKHLFCKHFFFLLFLFCFVAKVKRWNCCNLIAFCVCKEGKQFTASIAFDKKKRKKNCTETWKFSVFIDALPNDKRCICAADWQKIKVKRYRLQFNEFLFLYFFSSFGFVDCSEHRLIKDGALRFNAHTHTRQAICRYVCQMDSAVYCNPSIGRVADHHSLRLTDSHNRKKRSVWNRFITVISIPQNHLKCHISIVRSEMRNEKSNRFDSSNLFCGSLRISLGSVCRVAINRFACGSLWRWRFLSISLCIFSSSHQTSKR